MNQLESTKVKMNPAKRVCFLGLFIALRVVLGMFSIQVLPQVRVSVVGFLPIAMAGMLLGPGYAALADAAGDIINFFLVTHAYGPYFPGYTVTAALSGLLYGLFLYRKEVTWKRSALCLLPVVLVLEMCLNSLWVYMTASWGYFISNLPWRVVTNLLEYPVRVALLVWMGRLVKRLPKNLL